VAAIAGTVRRISIPARAPIAKAASVQAANAAPRRPKHAGRERDRVARGDERLVVPRKQRAERPGYGGHLDPAPRQQDEVIGHPLQHVRQGDAIVGDLREVCGAVVDQLAVNGASGRVLSFL
jgi:hypothetical protein